MCWKHKNENKTFLDTCQTVELSDGRSKQLSQVKTAGYCYQNSLSIVQL